MIMPTLGMAKLLAFIQLALLATSPLVSAEEGAKLRKALRGAEYQLEVSSQSEDAEELHTLPRALEGERMNTFLGYDTNYNT